MVYFPKSQPAPASLTEEKLKKNGTYRTEDVHERLKKDFKNKCYICESKAPTSINIEHFKPHKESDIDLKFDWNNLFFSCGHCNNTKLAQFDNILNCTIEEHLVETQINYQFECFPKSKPHFNFINKSEIVNNTINLLEKVFNGDHTANKKQECANLRKSLLNEMKKFNALLINFENSEDEFEIETLKSKINKEIKTSSAFTAFKRWVIRENGWENKFEF